MKNKLKNITMILVIISIVTTTLSIISYASNDFSSIQIIELDNEIKEEDIMTYDEILERMVRDGIDRDDAIKSLYDNAMKNPNGFVSRSANIRNPRSLSYTTRSAKMNVSNSYKPSINFYVEVDSGHGAYYMSSILNVNMDRNYRGITKVFSGNVYYKLETPTRLYYTIDGDFYNTGSISWSIGGAVGVGKSGSASANVSGKREHYKGFYTQNYIHYGNVN